MFRLSIYYESCGHTPTKILAAVSLMLPWNWESGIVPENPVLEAEIKGFI